MTSSAYKLGMGFLAVSIAGLLVYTYTRSSQPPLAAPARAANSAANQSAQQVLTTPNPPPGVRNNRTVPGSVHPFPNVPRTRTGMDLESDPFVAESVEEQRWLDRNGYPNEQQLAAYSTASNQMLERAVQAGDKLAAVVLAGRKLGAGDALAGAELMTAGANGSGYALSTLAAYMAGSSKGNPSLAYSLLRVNELRGDWRSAIARSQLPVDLDSLERAKAEAEALRMFREMQRNSSLRNFVDPRPIGR